MSAKAKKSEVFRYFIKVKSEFLAGSHPISLMKNKNSGAGAMFMKRKAPRSELCHFYDGSAALK